MLQSCGIIIKALEVLEKRIEIIQSSFQAGKLEAEKFGLTSTCAFEAKVPNEFISVAFEGFSMGIALKSLRENQSLVDWNVFFNNHGQKHTSQVYVGLGWALCELDVPLESALHTIDGKWKLRILDGYGYYSAIFKRRETIRKMEIPCQISADFVPAFNQGIGRSLWYISNGDVERLNRNIELFASTRRYDIWRGVGIAMTFVGGIQKDAIEKIEACAGNAINELHLGILMAQSSRLKAESVSSNADTIANHFLKNDAELLLCLNEIDGKTYSDISTYLNQLRKIL